MLKKEKTPWLLLAAAADPACTGQDLATLHGVAGV